MTFPLLVSKAKQLYLAPNWTISSIFDGQLIVYQKPTLQTLWDFVYPIELFRYISKIAQVF